MQGAPDILSPQKKGFEKQELRSKQQRAIKALVRATNGEYCRAILAISTNDVSAVGHIRIGVEPLDPQTSDVYYHQGNSGIRRKTLQRSTQTTR
jgi:hypothetical protein